MYTFEFEGIFRNNDVVAIACSTDLAAVKAVAQNMAIGFSGEVHADLDVDSQYSHLNTVSSRPQILYHLIHRKSNRETGISQQTYLIAKTTTNRHFELSDMSSELGLEVSRSSGG